MELIGNMRYHYFTTITKMDWKCKYKSKRKKKFPAESKWRDFFYLPFLRGFTWQKYIILSSFPVCLKCKSLQKLNKPLASFPEPGISFSQFYFLFFIFYFFFALCHVESSWYPLQRKLRVLTPGSPVESRNIFLKDLKYNQQRRQLSISMSTGRWQPDFYTSLDSSCKTTIYIKERNSFSFG